MPLPSRWLNWITRRSRRNARQATEEMRRKRVEEPYIPRPRDPIHDEPVDKE